MAWIEPQRIPVLASGVAMALLALLLAAVDFHKRVNRAFAAVMALRGAALVLGSLSLRPADGAAIQGFQPYLSLAVFPLLLLFGSLFPRRRGFLARPGMGWVVIAAILALWAVYFASHATYLTLARGVPPAAIQGAGPGLYDASFGPLAVLGFGIFPLMAALGLLFARDYTRSNPGTQRTSYFLVASGFLVNGVFDGARQGVGLFRLVQSGAAFPWLPWGWTIAVLPALSLLFALAGLVYIAAHTFRGRLEERRDERRREGLLFALAAAAGLTGIAPLLLPAGSEFFDHPAMLILLGFWRLTLPLFVSHALLRYALFDIDLKVRAAVAWTLVAGLVGGMYFVVSELTSNLIQDKAGTWAGIGAAALLALGGERLARFGRRAAQAIMPGVKEVRDVPLSAGEEIYRQQFLMLQEDGVLTAKERLCLETLRGRLKLSEKRVVALEASLRRPAPSAA